MVATTRRWTKHTDEDFGRESSGGGGVGAFKKYGNETFVRIERVPFEKSVRSLLLLLLLPSLGFLVLATHSWGGAIACESKLNSIKQL